MNLSAIRSNAFSTIGRLAHTPNNQLIHRIASVTSTIFSIMTIAATGAFACSFIPLWVPVVLFGCAATSMAIERITQKNEKSPSGAAGSNDTAHHQPKPHRPSGSPTTLTVDEQAQAFYRPTSHSDKTSVLSQNQEVPRPATSVISSPGENSPFPFDTFDKFFQDLRNKHPLVGTEIHSFNWKHWKEAISAYLKENGMENQWGSIVSNSGLNLLDYLLLNLVHKGIKNEEATFFLIEKGLARDKNNYKETPLQAFITVLTDNKHLWVQYYVKDAEIPPERDYNDIILELLVEAKKNGDKEEWSLVQHKLPQEFQRLLQSEKLIDL